MRVEVMDLKGKKVSDLTVNKELFNDKFNPILVKEVVEYQQSKARQATYGTNGMADLSYSNKKMFRQKGTGRARVGRRGAPHHRKGRVAFGPDGRIYEYTIPKTKIKSALNMCLAKKLNNNEVIFVDSLDMKEIKTKNFVECTKALSLKPKSLFVDIDKQDNLYLSMRNTIGYNFLPLMGLNVLSLIKSGNLVITANAWKNLEERYESK